MFCQNCGKQIPAEAKFCNFCGAPQSATEQKEAPANARPSQERREAPPYAQANAGRAKEPPQAARQSPQASATAPSALLGEMRRQSVRSSVWLVVIGAIIGVLFIIGAGPLVGLPITVIAVGLCCIPLIRAVNGFYQKDAVALLKSIDGFKRADAFFKTTKPVQGFYMSGDFVYFQKGRTSVLLRPWDVAWAYHRTVTHLLLFFIPVGKTHSVVLRTMDGRSYETVMSKDKSAELLNAVSAALPGTVVGFSQELENAYNNNRQIFAARWEEKVPGCTTGRL